VIRPFIVQPFYDLDFGFGSTWQWLHPISQRQCGGMTIYCQATIIGRCIKNIVKVI